MPPAPMPQFKELRISNFYYFCTIRIYKTKMFKHSVQACINILEMKRCHLICLILFAKFPSKFQTPR